MKLWIRSQDKEILMKSPELRYNQKGNEHSLLAYDTLGVYRILGTYKSKERAIEVLDEIQNILKPKITLKYEPDDNAPIMNGEWEQSFKIKECSDIVQLDTYVYEMPKD